MSDNGFLYYLLPESNSPEIQLFPNVMYRIGRSLSNNILLTDHSISEVHAEMEFSEGTFVLKDLDGVIGTKVNDTPISSVALKNSDKLFFGRLYFTFTVRQLSPEIKTTITPEDTNTIEKDLELIIKTLEDSSLKKQLLTFQEKIKNSKKDIETLAYADDQTGLYNRRYFDRAISIELKKASRYEKAVSLILIDIDHFSQFNVIYGMQKSDSLLRSIGALLRENCRSSDIICRFSGDQMALFLPEQNIKQGVITAEKLRRIISIETKEIENIDITVSFGVSSTYGRNMSCGELIRKCQDALLQAKESGRNCTKAL